jgi:hypothetical protein
MGSLYRRDICLWSREQSAALRKAAGAGSNLAIDWENVAEEIESLGRSERSSLRGQIRRILEHLIKLEASPARDPRRGWVESIMEAQTAVEDTLRDSPSLRQEVSKSIQEELPRARQIVRDRMRLYDEHPTVDLETLSYSEEQVVGWHPEP